MKFIIVFFISLMVFSVEHEQLLNDCLNKDFNVSVSHKSFPLGLLDKKVRIQKEKCIIDIEHTSYKFIKKNWVIDVCREPVHIKSGAYGVEVHKKRNECEKSKAKKDDNFCQNYHALKLIILDDALIFAKGEKEDLESEHGKAYCAYSLIKKYSETNHIFSRNKPVEVETDLETNNGPEFEVREAKSSGIEAEIEVKTEEPFAPTVESVEKKNSTESK